MTDALPSPGELDILKLFWKHGGLSARELHDRIGDRQDWAISTTRTILERMRGKGLLTRRSVHGMAVYEAAHGKVQTIGQAIRRFSRGLMEMDAALPVSAFSGSALLSEEELAEIGKLLEKGERDE